MRLRVSLRMSLVILIAGCAPPAEEHLTTIEVDDAGASENAGPLYRQVWRYTARVPQTGLLTDIYWPVSGDDLQRFPQVFLLQGANVSKDDYSSFASRVAAYGFLVTVPDHDTVFGTLADIAAIEGTRQFVAEQNLEPQSPLAGRLDGARLGLMGHSFGGVAALDALQGICRFPFCRGEWSPPSNLAAVSVYGTNQCGPTGCESQDIASGAVAVQLVQGSRDGLAEPDDTRDTFERITGGPKQAVVVDGTNHYGITNTADPVGSNPDPVEPILEQAAANETIARWTAMFLRAYVLEDQQARAYIVTDGALEDIGVSVVFVPERIAGGE